MRITLRCCPNRISFRMAKRLNHPPKPHKYVRNAAIALTLLAFALGVGVAGYHYFNDLRWIDALVDASMILGGMGPVSVLKNDAAKLFASFYALFCGLLFVASAAILVAPWIHLMLHRLHADDEDEDDTAAAKRPKKR